MFFIFHTTHYFVGLYKQRKSTYKKFYLWCHVKCPVLKTINEKFLEIFTAGSCKTTQLQRCDAFSSHFTIFLDTKYCRVWCLFFQFQKKKMYTVVITLHLVYHLHINRKFTFIFQAAKFVYTNKFQKY